MSFVFYDTETTGTHTAFDQSLQFGVIRTEHELRELERFDIRRRLLPHAVPSPKTLLTNGRPPSSSATTRRASTSTCCARRSARLRIRRT